VAILIDDINDNAPHFDVTALRVSVSEAQPADTPFFIAHAVDIDVGDKNGRVTYRLVSARPSGPFMIRPLTGELVLTAPLDYESCSEYDLVIGAQDGGIPQRTANLTLKLLVLDANDNAPVFDRAEYLLSVSEDVAVMSNVLTVIASDRDSGRYGRVTYTLHTAGTFSDPPLAVFADTGVVYVRKPLDRETLDSFTMTIVAVDGGLPSLNATATLHVHVTDVNDNPPNCSTLDKLQVAENAPIGTLVGVLRALDPDAGVNGTVVYYVQSEETSSAFRIDATGDVYTAMNLDTESRDIYSIEVRAQDGGRPSLSTVCLVNIAVNDVNDNDPFFVLPHQSRLTISELQPEGTEVMQVRANDPDAGENGTVEYRLKAGNELIALYFTLDVDSGVLRSRRVIDYDTLSSPTFDLVIVATDRGRPPRRAEKKLTIEILDVTDGRNHSQFFSGDKDVITFSVSETIVVGARVGVVDAVRAAYVQSLKSVDQSLLDESFEIIAGNSQARFEIDKVTSAIYVVAPLDYETTPVCVCVRAHTCACTCSDAPVENLPTGQLGYDGTTSKVVDRAHCR
jgi:hypothetical protein